MAITTLDKPSVFYIILAMIPVEFKNSAMETAAECTNWQPLPSGELNLTKANFNRGVI